MTKLEYAAQALEIALGLILVLKLLSLRLHAIYQYFSLYLVCELIGSTVWILVRSFDRRAEWSDYRLLWAAQQIVVDTIIILTVYTLLGTVLDRLPGILTLSRRYLNFTFVAAGLISTGSLAWESHKSGYVNQGSWQDNVLFVAILADRAVSIVVLLSILAILCFLLWFPVQIARNLAVFIVGFSVYSAGSSFGLLFQGSITDENHRLIISTSLELLTSACYAYWVIFISPAGEQVPARLNVRRDPEEQDRLIRSLELLNESVLRSASR